MSAGANFTLRTTGWQHLEAFLLSAFTFLSIHAMLSMLLAHHADVLLQQEAEAHHQSSSPKQVGQETSVSEAGATRERSCMRPDEN